ncbi:hypothetical protein FMM05_14870 [Flavobacterium zepuense]|uniref:SGNH/GDSL hydrolase family protein n=1 Tax=Flavobacterium zepuense TaxID=2593302 RepID=A0A552UXM5_9FLAO|nr:hypothetical protein [Flavobacterium zepuense]TRW22978.1 hypothetical protein FMM05_14870 [Flavobacterium zepuense]
MRKFLIKLNYFLIPVVLGWLLLEIFYRAVPNNYTEKNKHIRGSYNDCQTLILGNSHTFYGLNPDDFTAPAFNISNVSQTLFYDKLLFEKHVDSFAVLKNIIIPIEYSSLSHSDFHPELEWRKYFYEDQMDLDTQTISDFDVKKYSLALVPRFSLTIFSLREYLKSGTLVECSTKGWRRQNGVNELYNNPKMAKIIADKHEDGSVDFRKNVQRLKNIIAACNKRGITVVLVTMPVTSNYAANVNQQKLALITKECSQLAKIKNVYYLNLFQDSLFQDTDFYDTDHLNSGGAKKCSQLLDRFIKSINN